ncbi:MAG TPA: acyl-CoA dehydrogenase family protein [Candidatus Xenobia bacterium]|jgi:alkylation response protein AidB-like acyl-CoA dehydrogenase
MTPQEAACRLATEFLKPRAEAVDRLDLPLAENLQALAAAGLAGLTIAEADGGLGASPEVHRTVARELAAACGVTHFTVAQHWSACHLLATGQAEPLKRRLLPELARGQRWVAIAFAHLRRPGPPVLRATLQDGGWILDGEAPWLTGWSLMDSAVVGATQPDGSFVYVWTPLAGLVASPPLRLCAMEASATVRLTFSQWFVPLEHTLFVTDLEATRIQDRANVLRATSMTLGCSRAAVELVEALAAKRRLDSIRQAAERLRARYQALVTAIDAAGADFDANLSLRLKSIELAVHASHAAVAAASGAANLRDHPAQRLYREAMFYTVQAQTHEVLEGLMDQVP